MRDEGRHINTTNQETRDCTRGDTLATCAANDLGVHADDEEEKDGAGFLGAGGGKGSSR
jgi:hypothetical protein